MKASLILSFQIICILLAVSCSKKAQPDTTLNRGNQETNELSEDQSEAFRKNYAGVGFTYDETRDAFIPPQPYPSWTLNELSCLWESPIPYPNDEQIYNWNEETQTWESQE